MDIVVRRPTLDDVDDLARINIDAWRDAYTGLVPNALIDEMDMSTYRPRWFDHLSAGRRDVGYFVADVDGVLASYAIGGPYRTQDGDDPEPTSGLAELYAIYVDPPVQRCGAGVAVHEALLSWLANGTYTEVVLWVLAANGSSRSWYAHLGWRPDGAVDVWTAHGQRLPEVRLRRTL